MNSDYQICKNCAKWINQEDFKASDRYRLCDIAVDTSDSGLKRDTETAPIVSYDEEQYCSSVETRFDFGCNRWEPVGADARGSGKD